MADNMQERLGLRRKKPVTLTSKVTHRAQTSIKLRPLAFDRRIMVGEVLHGTPIEYYKRTNMLKIFSEEDGADIIVNPRFFDIVQES